MRMFSHRGGETDASYGSRVPSPSRPLTVTCAFLINFRGGRRRIGLRDRADRQPATVTSAPATLGTPR
jgi:hypothetical protein